MHGTELLGGQPRIQQVVTFNGVGIGVVDPGTNLTQLISQFKTLSANEDGQAFTFSDAGLSALYQRARQTIKDGGSLSAEDKAMLTSLINPSGDGAVTVDATTKAQALMIWDAIGRIGIIRQEVERLTTIGSGDETGSRPVKVKDSDIGQENLDYQMAVLTVGASTDAASLIGGLVRTYHGKVYTSTIFANQFDVIGASNTAAWRLVA
ncbi:MAG: hypothetical protein JF606_27420 [Burkholderiales bacterium]|nr:hypothetical protein [Burkholderiales bacterium]